MRSSIFASSTLGLFALLATFGFPTGNLAQSPAPAGVNSADSSRGAEIVSRLAKSFDALNIDYNATCQAHSNIGGDVFLAPALTPEKRSSLHYVASGDHYYYQASTSWWNQQAPDEWESTYNGALYQHFASDQGRLAVGKKASGLDTEFDRVNAVFLPFDFLGLAPDAKTRRGVQLSLLQVAKVWQEALKTMQEHAVNSPNSEFVCFEFPGGSYEGVHERLCYRVFFRLSDGFPMRWQLVTEDHAVVREYVVDKLAEAKGFKYPQQARILEYGMHLKTPDLQPRATVEVTVNSLSVNAVKPDDDVFTIEASKATLLFDRDADVGIPIPR